MPGAQNARDAGAGDGGRSIGRKHPGCRRFDAAGYANRSWAYAQMRGAQRAHSKLQKPPSMRGSLRRGGRRD